MTVYEMEQKMPAEEFYQWMEYSRVEPFNVAEVQMAGLLSVVSAYAGGEGSPSEFMVSGLPKKDESEDKPLTGATLENYLKGLT